MDPERQREAEIGLLDINKSKNYGRSSTLLAQKSPAFHGGPNQYQVREQTGSDKETQEV